MSTTLESRAGVRRAEAVALLAADAACDAYRETLDESQRDTVSPERVIAVVRGGPGDALASAVADLGSTAFAAARAAHLAAEAASLEDARRAGELAESAAEAARAGAHALSSHDAAGLVTLCHAAAMTAHLAADALDAFGGTAASSSVLERQDGPPVPFPPSWRACIDDSSSRLAAMRRRAIEPVGDASRDLIEGAEAATSAASHALRTYQRSGHGTGVSRAVGRVTRIAALGSAYAAGAALDLAERR